MDKTYNNKLGMFSPVKLLDFDNAKIDMDFQNAFNNTECPLEREQSESTDYVNRQYGRKAVSYDQAIIKRPRIGNAIFSHYYFGGVIIPVSVESHSLRYI